MSYKNSLQEALQALKIPLPAYITYRIDVGIDHEPTWKSCISVNGIEFTGIGNTKREAECKAAEDAMKQFQQKKEYVLIEKESFYNIDFNLYKGVFLVDGENHNFKTHFPNTHAVLIFVAKNTSKHIVMELQEHNNVFVFISDAVGKDAADHLLTFYAGKLSIIIKHDFEYIIVTKDHFGEFLTTFLPNCKFSPNF